MTGSNVVWTYELDCLAVYSVRYALGRVSYAPNEVQTQVSSLWPRLQLSTRDTILRDVRHWLTSYQLDAFTQTDCEEWRDWLAKMEAWDEWTLGNRFASESSEPVSESDNA